jgi:hypothetical protein
VSLRRRDDSATLCAGGVPRYIRPLGRVQQEQHHHWPAQSRKDSQSERSVQALYHYLGISWVWLDERRWHAYRPRLFGQNHIFGRCGGASLLQLDTLPQPDGLYGRRYSLGLERRQQQQGRSPAIPARAHSEWKSQLERPEPLLDGRSRHDGRYD